MHIREINIKKFRHLENLIIGPLNMPKNISDLVVLAGPNGSGKSSVLELISYALSNSWSLQYKLPRALSNNSFEVCIELSQSEIDLIESHLKLVDQKDIEMGIITEYPFISQLRIKPFYYRAFNFTEGEYNRSPKEFNQIHAYVTAALRNRYKRSSGIFLKADRAYPTKAFERNKIFEFNKMLSQDHLWSTAYETSEIQYGDMFDFLVQQKFHFHRRLGEYHDALQKNKLGDRILPSDPLKPYDDLLKKVFPGYSFAEKNEEVPSNLFISIPSGDIISFNDLSSGEKEIFFLLSFFIRHNVENSVVVIDEPELHLHPELSRILIRTMQQLKMGNQIWLATHNPEIIDEAGRDKTIYFSRDHITNKSQMTLGVDEDKSLRHFRDLFGYSGYIGVAKNIVFLEGDSASTERKSFTKIFKELSTQIKFVPAFSSDNASRINAVILSILESNFGFIRFHLIRDRDYLTPEEILKYNSHPSKRIFVLKKHEIENYLLNMDLISKVQKEYFDSTVSPGHVESQFREIALSKSGEILRDMVSYRLNYRFRPQDFSLGGVLNRQGILNADLLPDSSKISSFKRIIISKSNEISAQMLVGLEEKNIEKLVEDCLDEIRSSFISDTWLDLFPGKELIEVYVKKNNLKNSIAFQNILINQMAETESMVPKELLGIVNQIISEN